MDLFEKMFAGGKSLLSESFTVEMVYTMTCAGMGDDGDTPLDHEFRNLEQALCNHAGKGIISIKRYQATGAHRPPSPCFESVLTITEFMSDKIKYNEADPKQGAVERHQVAELIKRALRKHAAGEFTHGEITDDYDRETPQLNITTKIDGADSKRYFLGYGLDDGDWFDPWRIDSEHFHDLLAKEVAKGYQSLYVFDDSKSIIRIESEVLDAVRSNSTFADEAALNGTGHLPGIDVAPSGLSELENKIKECLETYEAEGFYEARIQSKDKLPDNDSGLMMDIRYYASQLG